jgi:protein PhnA
MHEGRADTALPTLSRRSLRSSYNDRDNEKDASMNVKDSNGTPLSEGDSVTVIKDLKVKGTSLTIKRGTLIKGIRLTDDEEEIECKVEKIKDLVLKTCFLKKA